MNINLRFQYGSKFEITGDRLLYKKGSIYLKKDVDLSRLSKIELERFLKDDVGVDISIKELWYLEAGQSITNGLRQIVTDNDVVDMVKLVGVDRTAHLYVVGDNDPSPSVIRRSLSIAQSLPGSTAFHNSYSVNNLVNESEDDGDIILGSDSSSSDSDFDIDDGDDKDDDMFEEFVDKSVPDDVRALVIQEDDAISLEEVEGDSEELRSGGCSDSDGEKKHKYPEFNHLVDFKNRISFEVGMRFGSNDIFRRALRQFSVENGGDYYFLHNDNYKVSAYCKYKCDCSMNHSRKKCTCKKILCGFKVCARKMGHDGSFQLKSFNPSHACGWQHVNSKVTSVWLAETYLEHYRDDPRWRVRSFIKTVRRNHKVDINYTQAWRARLRAYLMTQGDAAAQYGKVWDYAATIKKFNPGSSAYVKVCLDDPERPLFQRLYICLDACKKGFLEGCRPIIGLDGCHLKGAYTGQILTAVGKDANENIFPVAFAVVEAERKETWIWFMENLVQDLGGASITYMSDRQKGLIEALNHVVPMAETRVCVRHLYNNFRVKWPGKSFKDALWAAAKSSTRFEFEEAMNYIRGLDEGAYSYLIQANPSTWSLHAFKSISKSDMLLNNVCETFNSCILESRDMPILTMCDWIRRKLMKRFVTKREKIRNSVGSVTQKAMKRLEKARDVSLRLCRAHWGGGDRFEVDHLERTYVVDLGLRSCGCYKWDLTGIPCSHAIACILMRRMRLEDFVHQYYHKETYFKSYSSIIEPMPGEDHLEQTGMIPPLPPAFVVQPGRPKKTRKKEQGEQVPGKQKRFRYGKNKCSQCGVEGHTKRKCTNPSKAHEPPKPKEKGGRPKNPKTVRISSESKQKTSRQVPTTSRVTSTRGQPLPKEHQPHSLQSVQAGNQTHKSYQVGGYSYENPTYNVDTVMSQSQLHTEASSHQSVLSFHSPSSCSVRPTVESSALKTVFPIVGTGPTILSSRSQLSNVIQMSSKQCDISNKNLKGKASLKP